MDENLHVNDLLSIGTHNSYKTAIPDAEMAQLRARSSRAAIVLDYSHRPWRKSSTTVRAGWSSMSTTTAGRTLRRSAGPRSLGQGLDAAVTAELAKPGFKVMHIPDVDFRSTCIRFVTCLQTIKAWSDAHPDHIPIAILINAKDDNPLGAGGARSRSSMPLHSTRSTPK